jgi:hypothetical protein
MIKVSHVDAVEMASTVDRFFGLRGYILKGKDASLLKRDSVGIMGSGNSMEGSWGMIESK